MFKKGSAMDTIFKGNAQIYLQGFDALLPAELQNSNQMKFYLGSENSRLQVTDFRKEPMRMAKRVLDGEDIQTFADIFNQPAWVEVKVNQSSDDVNIELYDDTTNVEYPILWMGVLTDNRLPAFDLDWEFFRILDQSRTAFAAMVR
jgi:hypothetical protein